MKFDNSISIGDIISILALLVTFFTLLMMKKQREDANRPYLVVDYNNRFDEGFSLETKNLSEEKNINDEIYSIDKNPFDFKVINVGNGVAREVSVKIKFENIDIIKQDNNMYVKDQIITFDYSKIMKSTHVMSIILHDSKFEFTNLGSNNSFSLTNSLRKFEKTVNNVLTYYMNTKSLESIQEKLIPTIKVEVEYKSILNKKFKETYKIDIRLCMFSNSKCYYSVELKNSKV